jgi:hypothetical protein
VKERARLERDAAIPEEEKKFWALYRAVCNEGQPTKADIKTLLKTREEMGLCEEVESILRAHNSWIENELKG